MRSRTLSRKLDLEAIRRTRCERPSFDRQLTRPEIQFLAADSVALLVSGTGGIGSLSHGRGGWRRLHIRVNHQDSSVECAGNHGLFRVRQREVDLSWNGIIRQWAQLQ